MEMKIYEHDAGHMTKMVAMPIYGKIPLKLFFPGTIGMVSTKLGLYKASGTLANHSSFKLLLCVDLDLSFGKVKFSNLGFYIAKRDTDGFF